MPLKILLKPGERVIIGGAVVRNGGHKAELLVENKVPILRQKDIISFKEADTICKKIYFVIQLMYMDEGNLAEHHQTYWTMVKELVRACPSVLGLIDRISEEILGGNYYQALKWTRKLMEYEEEVLSRVSEPV
jgi:flagellar protein FlbT